MDALPPWAQIGLLVLLLACSAFFSISETAMMAQNRSRLRHDAKNGSKSAKLTQGLMDKVESLLSTILIGNNLLNTAITTIVTAVAISSFGSNDKVLTIATLVVSALIIVFAEITPKVVGATYPDRIARIAAYPLTLFRWLLTPIVFFTNAFVSRFLRLFGLKLDIEDDGTQLTQQELRSIVLESQHLIPAKPRTILLNLLNLEDLRVDDVMTPRSQVEVVDVSRGDEHLRSQLATCYHNKLPVVEGDMGRIVGMLHVRRALGAMLEDPLTVAEVRALAEPPVYIPAGTPVLRQLQQFQESGSRLGLVVDEYGEVLGLVTLEDIVEEIVGEYTTASPRAGFLARSDDDGAQLVDASTPVRILNRRMKLGLSEDGPTTLNGVLLEILQDLPDGETAVRLGNVVFETVQVEANTIRTVRVRKLGGSGIPRSK
jgi:Mg2+/Co2+ transporter CorB